MKLSELFRSDVVTTAPADTVERAARKMKDRNVGAVVVVEGQKVVGIVTDRDVALKLALGEAQAGTPVSEIMTRNVLTIWDDQGIFNATQYVKGHKVRRLPIIDRDEKLVGLLSTDDLFGILAREILNVAQSLEPAIGTRV